MFGNFGSCLSLRPIDRFAALLSLSVDTFAYDSRTLRLDVRQFRVVEGTRVQVDASRRDVRLKREPLLCILENVHVLATCMCVVRAFTFE